MTYARSQQKVVKGLKYLVQSLEKSAEIDEGNIPIYYDQKTLKGK